MADKKPSKGFIAEALEDLLDGIGDIAEGTIFDFNEDTPEAPTKEVVKDGNGSGSAASVHKDESGGSKRDESTGQFKSAADKLRSAFTAPKEKGKATGVEGTSSGESGDSGTGGKDE
jgi:hypothetical protein